MSMRNILFHVSTFLVALVQSQCAENWISYGDNCYYTDDSQKTWDEARQFCESKEANLVKIDDADENAFFGDNCNVGSSRRRCWTGLRETDEVQCTEYVDNNCRDTELWYWTQDDPSTAVAFDQLPYTNWIPHSPDNKGFHDENRVLIMMDNWTRAKWEDAPSTSIASPFCEAGFCEETIVTSYGVKSCNQHMWGQECILQCPAGTTGSQQAHLCTSSGWEGNPLECWGDCPARYKGTNCSSNGHAGECWIPCVKGTGDIVKYTCDDGTWTPEGGDDIVCYDDCDGVLPDGQICHNFNHGSKCSQECPWRTMGDELVHTCNDGNWEPDGGVQIDCKSDCPSVTDNTNCAHKHHDDHCVVECPWGESPGTGQPKSLTRTCNDGTWMGGAFKCFHNCPSSFLTTQCPHYLHGDTCELTCDYGYVQYNNDGTTDDSFVSIVTCNDGVWKYNDNTKKLKCKLVCSNWIPNFGESVECNDHYQDDVCGVGCPDGFSGAPVQRVCKNGKWHGNNLNCVKKCPATDFYGTQCLEDTPGGTCEVNCADAHAVTTINSGEFTCNDEGQWVETEPPVCKMNCSNGQTVGGTTCPSASDGDTCDVTCPEGTICPSDDSHCLNQNQSVFTYTCTHGAWEPSPEDYRDHCMRECIKEFKSNYGTRLCRTRFKHNETCTLTCPKDTTGSDSTIRCDNGAWVEEGQFKCNYDCETQVFGATTCPTTTHGNSCNVKCPRGTSSRSKRIKKKCNDGRWTGKQLNCKHDCEATIMATPCSDYSHGDTCTVRCPTGKTHFTDRDRMTQGDARYSWTCDNGQWTGDMDCVNDCSENIGSMHCPDNTHGGTCIMACPSGTTRWDSDNNAKNTDTAYMICNDGNWEGISLDVAAECMADCQPQKLEMTTDCELGIHGTSCNVACQDGTTGEAECRNGAWTMRSLCLRECPAQLFRNIPLNYVTQCPDTQHAAECIVTCDSSNGYSSEKWPDGVSIKCEDGVFRGIQDFDLVTNQFSTIMGPSDCEQYCPTKNFHGHGYSQTCERMKASDTATCIIECQQAWPYKGSNGEAKCTSSEWELVLDPSCNECDTECFGGENSLSCKACHEDMDEIDWCISEDRSDGQGNYIFYPGCEAYCDDPDIQALAAFVHLQRGNYNENECNCKDTGKFACLDFVALCHLTVVQQQCERTCGQCVL